MHQDGDFCTEIGVRRSGSPWPRRPTATAVLFGYCWVSVDQVRRGHGDLLGPVDLSDWLTVSVDQVRCGNGDLRSFAITHQPHVSVDQVRRGHRDRLFD